MAPFQKQPPCPSTAPDPVAIEVFAKTVFGDCDGFVAIRQFPEKGGGAAPLRTPFARADDGIAARLVAEAHTAASSGLALYVIPGSVSEAGRAKADDVVGMQVVLVDLDQGDIAAKREHLVRHLGLPSLEVASGGITADSQQKLHLYWKLTEPAHGDDVATVCQLRGAIAGKVGGDPSFRSAHQPIRVAGSVYRKGGVERLTTVIAERPIEYDLAQLAMSVQLMPPLDGGTAIGTDNDERVSAKLPVKELFGKLVREGGVDGVTRHDALSQIIGYWLRRFREGEVTQEQAWEEIVAYNEARIDPPWPLERLQRETAALRRRDEERNSSDTSDPSRFTEDALAGEFTRRFGDDWAYVAVWGQWLVWTGVHWERETTLHAYDLARIVCRDIAARSPQPGLQRKLSSASTVAAVERLARADRRHAATSDRWDRDSWLLNTPDGVVDLRSGELRDHDRSLAMTKVATAGPRGDCPAWRQFLATITGGDAELQAYLQRVAGYCLTGVTSEHALFFIYGTGANGKSVFINVLSTLLGDYATTAPIDMFMASASERHPTDLAGLRGARLVSAVETEEGRRWAESRLKALTGGDAIKARFMRQDFFEFVPRFKLVIAGNHRPAIRNLDEAMRRRFHMVPFTVTIPRDQRDKRLTERLLAERDGILAWALAGCLDWQRVGLQPPAAVIAATQEYFAAEDALGRWLDERCDTDANHEERSSDLFADWRVWAEANGEYVGSIKRLSENLSARGFARWRDRHAKGFRGLALRPDPAVASGEA